MLMKIEEMPAGKELDTLVAEKIMGWTKPECQRIGGCLKKMFGPDNKCACDSYNPLEGYSTHILPAWDVFLTRYLASQVIGYWVFDPKERPDLTDITNLGWAREWFCTCDGKPIAAPTAPLAICRAALKAVSNEV
jgi:hypothetical protein